ncbi:MAG TPA: HIT domain-containing protein, partial [Ktedonobacteraceae bacterium]
MFSSQPFDMDAYEKRSKGPCFICEMLAGNPDYQHHLIYEDQTAVAFLNKYPTVYGYALVAPREHREQATGDFTLEDYLV